MSRRERSIDEADVRLFARVGEVFRPAPLDEPGGTRFDARLRERIETRRARRPGPPVAVAAAALAALLALAVWPGGSEAPEARGAAVSAPGGSESSEGWEQELFLAADEARVEDVEAGLPDDYVAIAHAFSTP